MALLAVEITEAEQRRRARRHSRGFEIRSEDSQ
jgi:hypothetical protein